MENIILEQQKALKIIFDDMNKINKKFFDELPKKQTYHKIIEDQMEALQGYIHSSVKTADEEAEIDEDDEEKIADAVDTEDLGAKADYAYANEVNK